jgi:hypothetical protein
MEVTAAKRAGIWKAPMMNEPGIDRGWHNLMRYLISVAINGDTLVLAKSPQRARGALIEAFIRRHEVE